MTYITPDEARNYKCPVARTFAEKIGPNCDADGCILWRWKKALASDPLFMSAVKREEACLAQEDGKGRAGHLYHKQAVANVAKNPEGYGVKSSVGHCGLAAMPS